MTSSDFWAYRAAERVVNENREPVVKGGVSPSGVPHLGNFNEVLRGYFVAKELDELGVDARQVFTWDDRDPLRKVPGQLVDSEGCVVEVDDGMEEELSDYLGHSYVDIPDPFGCCDSWARHFSGHLEQAADDLGVDLDFISTDSLYTDGEMDQAIRMVLDDLDGSRELIMEHQRTADESYIPYMPLCGECGRITATAVSIDLEGFTVDYECVDKDIAGSTISGCGHSGTTSLRDGKLPWRFEWPAQWMILCVGFEPFGKDHAEGSWKSGQEIAREIYGIEPPEPLVYEFILVDGEKMSGSAGNIYTVDELLEMIEPEALKYFFSLDPGKQRDFRLSEIHHLVNEFDRIESIHYGDIEPADDTEELYAEHVYSLLVQDEWRRPRVPFSFAAMVGVAGDDRAVIKAVQRAGHIPEDAGEREKEAVLQRVRRARNWAQRMDNKYNLEIIESPPGDIDFPEEVRDGFRALADYIDEGHSADEIQNRIFDEARNHEVDIGDFFRYGYLLFLGRESGPKLGPLLSALDREFVVSRLRAV